VGRRAYQVGHADRNHHIGDGVTYEPHLHTHRKETIVSDEGRIGNGTHVDEPRARVVVLLVRGYEGDDASARSARRLEEGDLEDG
jgi:hypothetical protein